MIDTLKEEVPERLWSLRGKLAELMLAAGAV